MEKENKTNFLKDHFGIQSHVITKVETQLGYLQVLEYILQDWNYLHVVQWHLKNVLEENSTLPKVHCKSFYREKYKAMELAHEIGNNLLQQYVI